MAPSSSDAVKSTILRESGKGWNSPPSNQTSPLRIAKRESSQSPVRQVQVARRSSSSFKHVRNNNLVSKSPFKSQIPTTNVPPIPRPTASPAGPRKVSGEKRPRPNSMHEQAETENERPFALKRERRQSKTFQAIFERAPVTKSPFNHSSDEQRPLQPLSPSKIPIAGGLSPTRPSLVSRRLHGPRLSGGVKRERRKTVTFDERCDVVEFDQESIEEDVFDSDDQYGDEDKENEDDPFIVQDSEMHADVEGDAHSQEDSFDGAPEHLDEDIDPNASITGIVDEMLNTTTGQRRSCTPPLNQDIPTDLDTEEGIPFGRAHHAERSRDFHEQERYEEHPTPPRFPLPQQGSQPKRRRDSPSVPFPFNTPTHASSGSANTPPRKSPINSPPLGRSTHVERIQDARQREVEEEGGSLVDQDVQMLPASPSPMKPSHRHLPQIPSDRDGLVPRFGVDIPGTPNKASSNDPFRMETLDEESFEANGADDNEGMNDTPTSSHCFDDKEPYEPNGGDTASLVGKPPNSRSSVDGASPPGVSTPPVRRSPLPPIPTQANAPHGRSPSPANNQALNGSGGRMRITREEVQRRLLHKRSFSSSPSPIGSPAPQGPSPTNRLSLIEEAKSTSFEDGIHVHSPEIVRQEEQCSNIEVEEKAELGMLNTLDGGRHQLKFDFGSKFGRGGLGIDGLNLDETDFSINEDNMSPVEDKRSAQNPKASDVDMDMRSALDRLMDDVAGTHPDDSMATEDTEELSPIQNQLPRSRLPTARPMERAATDSALLSNGFGSRTVSGASTDSMPPQPPPKDNIRSREQLIIEKRREAKRIEEEENASFYGLSQLSPPGNSKSKGRPSRRRSRSTGDVSSGVALDVNTPPVEDEGELVDSIQRELKKMSSDRKSNYLIRQRQGTIYASSSKDRISHMSGPGDVNAGNKAWRAVRRPSDMNEYSKQIKEFRSNEKGKAQGKVFVKVLGVKGMHLPLPQQPTVLTCTLNNGIHFVTTPEVQLGRDCRIEQEFELIEHSKLEFTLTLKIRRDPHITAQFKALEAPAPPPPAPPIVASQSSSRSGMRSFFSSSPKKTKEKVDRSSRMPAPQQQAPQPHRLPENLARYLKKADGTLARAFISFKDINTRCDTRLFETCYPLIGQRAETGGKFSNLQVGELVLQIFRLPPLPGVSMDDLPQSLEECHRGLRHVNWHKVTYFEGILTQNGGDCSSWRRRQLRVIGSKLVAFNDVTKKATATIELAKAIAVEDDQESAASALSPASGSSRPRRDRDEFEGLYGVERSFRLVFPDNEEIIFFADTDEEKSKWLEIFRALVGHIPPHPLWAELIWQRQHDMAKQAASAPSTTVTKEIPRSHSS